MRPTIEGEWPHEYARSIVHYELFRMEPYLVGTDGPRRHRGLLELEPPAQFNLVIADEAHHLRTPGTGSHQLIERLCLTAEAVLMLSATPVQVDRDNLYILLHLLRPELFPDKDVFEEVLEPNRHLTDGGKAAARRTGRERTGSRPRRRPSARLPDEVGARGAAVGSPLCGGSRTPGWRQAR